MLLTSDNSHFVASDLSGTFAGLMDLYERNYIGLRRLVPQIPVPQTALISSVPTGLNLHLRVIERFRYTTELHLTYYFTKKQISLAEPDLYLRIYHDARLAEVMAARLRHWPNFRAEWNPTDNLASLKVRWRTNRFLHKWLTYCLRQGHRFGNG